MKRQNIFKAAITSAFVLSLFAGSALAAMAPLNPAFTKAVERAQTLGTKTLTDPQLKGGRTPSPVDLSHLAGKIMFKNQVMATSRTASATDTAYDLRDEGYVTPVRDQNPYGACWTFSAMASLESTALVESGGIMATPDYSEEFLAYFGYMNQSSSIPGFDGDTYSFQDVMDNGGDDFKATALLARWTGIVNESNAPYGVIPSAGTTVARHLEDVYYIYLDTATRYQEANEQNIKNALVNFGAVSVGMFAGDPTGGNWDNSPYFNSTTYASYIPAVNPNGLSVGSANHAVTIVGWNNNYPKENFNILNRPSSDGAWIVKNSWGSSWGDSGYFYLSYEDAVLDTGAAYVSAPADNYDSIYQYDMFGWCNSYAPAGMSNNTAWFANVFTADHEETINAVSFYSGAAENTYEISVYVDSVEGPVSGIRKNLQSSSNSTAGYHTVDLATPVDVLRGQKFSVVVKLRTPGYSYPVAIEYPINNYSSKAVASAGQSYVSANGSTWTDAVAIRENANVCLKAFGKNATPATTGSIMVDIDPATAIADGAQWILDGEYIPADTAKKDLAPGFYTVSFKEISGWYSPMSGLVTVSAGNLESISGIYSPKASITGGTVLSQTQSSFAIAETAAQTVDISANNSDIEGLLGYVSGTFALNTEIPSSLETISSNVPTGGLIYLTPRSSKLKKEGWITGSVPMLYNYRTSTYEIPSDLSPVVAGSKTATADSFRFSVKDGGDYDSDRFANGTVTDAKVLSLSVKGSEGGGGSISDGGSGCSIGYAPSILLLGLPLILLKK